MPTLYKLNASPPVRAVLLCEKALGIQLKHVEVNLAKGEHLKPDYVKINPQHTIPTFVDDYGTAICDSHAIMTYMCDKYGKNDSLYPKNLAKRALINQRLYFESGVVFSLARRIVANFIAGHAEIDPECIELAHSAYDFVNKFLEIGKWITGDNLTIADFSLISSITSLDHLIPIDEKYSNVLRWIKSAEALPYYYEGNKKGLEMFRGFIASIRK